MLVATAGHVDHGKTSLVQALTGTNTDRLTEEKQRGLTIELGYAFAAATAKERIAFIDVPGHHRFINTMISGISGIDLGMLVVAANDGPMPQTLEHLQLLRLLGVERYISVITKIDLVDKERLDQVTEQVSALIPGAPLCAVSNRSAEGIEQLKSLLETQLQNCPQRASESLFRLYIDRAFIKKGEGIVVTGTCLSGTIAAGDELYLHPVEGQKNQAIKVRVRKIHSQGESAASGHAGQRCALNLAGKLSLEQAQRGGFLCAHSSATPSRRLDTRCWTAGDSKRALKHLARVKVYIGTRRMSAKTYFLDRGESPAAGQRIQLILDKDVLAFAGDRFVLRDDNENATLGGGIVIDPDAPKWGKSRKNRLKQLEALESGQPREALEQLLFTHGEIVSLRQYRRIWNLSQEELESLLSPASLNRGEFARVRDDEDELILSRRLWESYIQSFDEHLAERHSARPMEPGIGPEVLQKLVHRQIPKRLFKAVLDERIRAGKVVQEGQLIRAFGHRPTLSPQIQRDWQVLETCMKARALNIPLRSELQKDTGFDAKQLEALARPAIKAGDLFEIGEKRLALPSTLRELAGLLQQFIDKSGEVSVIEAKQVFGLGRNLTIEILEFFDQIGYTKRSANSRSILDPNAAPIGQQD
ncbi:selenocysteine-specific translation elongation factor [Parahaliea sp. F7430]|uniref:Selenocysteine-specific elongation factor n=1 Tax=Sediminihaliea albiluteola TaxID=2758564 RepID=A0A7W2TWF0_9GAMM|nr:selenocysteine-specific translation elongation factor [Sediminihaliea albiluteola]MBA6413156.1 selenocysteine-specific translation elongation factor [Sediminihaliea albiluteola]